MSVTDGAGASSSPLSVATAPSVRILGLDLSLNATGIACWRCGVDTVKPKKLFGPERLAFIEDMLRGHVMMGASGHESDLVVVEGYSFGSRGRAVFSIGELGGVVRLLLWRQEVPFVEIAPQTRAKFATGKGNAGKDEVLMKVAKWPDFEGSNNNEADAFILYKMGILHYNVGLQDIPQYQQEVVNSVAWPELVS